MVWHNFQRDDSKSDSHCTRHKIPVQAIALFILVRPLYAVRREALIPATPTHDKCGQAEIKIVVKDRGDPLQACPHKSWEDPAPLERRI
jgi:hypothetical protein